MIKLVDSHCHLQDDRLTAELPGVMERARQAGVTELICCGSYPGDWPLVKKISRTYPGIIPAYGLHPWYVDQAGDNWLETLNLYLEDPHALVGETGLDLKFSKCSQESQEQAFCKQLELAGDLKRPVSIHCVKAWHRMLPLLKDYNHAQVPYQLHSYNGGPDIVNQLAGLNVYYSFSGSLTRSRNKKAHKSIKIIPLDRLLIESDAPDIPPEINGTIDFETPNEPRILPWILETAASLLEMDKESLARQFMENTARFLGKQGRNTD